MVLTLRRSLNCLILNAGIVKANHKLSHMPNIPVKITVQAVVYGIYIGHRITFGGGFKRFLTFFIFKQKNVKTAQGPLAEFLASPSGFL